VKLPFAPGLLSNSQHKVNGTPLSLIQTRIFLQPKSLAKCSFKRGDDADCGLVVSEIGDFELAFRDAAGRTQDKGRLPELHARRHRLAPLRHGDFSAAQSDERPARAPAPKQPAAQAASQQFPSGGFRHGFYVDAFQATQP
jgi:hypothetical protein